MTVRKRKAPKWVPLLWQTTHRRVTIWVDQVYSRGKTWEWRASDPRLPVEVEDGGRAWTRQEAQRAAVAAVDRALDGGK